MGGEYTEELEPLFDYHRVQQPFDVVCLDDELSDSTSLLPPKRRNPSDISALDEDKKKGVHVVDCDEDDEDDWMPPPPKVSSDSRKFEEDPTIKELRLKKQELTSFAKSAEEVLRSVEESVKRDFDTAQSSTESLPDQPPKLNSERAKIVISIQDKDELKQFRVYKDEKFERLFTMYAEKIKFDLQSLVFCFDGDKINPSATPDSLGLEDDDIIEVHIKSK